MATLCAGSQWRRRACRSSQCGLCRYSRERGLAPRRAPCRTIRGPPAILESLWRHRQARKLMEWKASCRELRAHHDTCTVRMERQDDVGYPTEPREFIEFVLARTHHTCNSLTSAWPNVAQCDLSRFLDRSSTLLLVDRSRITARVDEFRTLLLAAYPRPSALPQLVAPERPVQVRDRPRHSFFLQPGCSSLFGRQLTIATLSPPRMVATRSTRSSPFKPPLEAPNTRPTPWHPPCPPYLHPLQLGEAGCVWCGKVVKGNGMGGHRSYCLRKPSGWGARDSAGLVSGMGTGPGPGTTAPRKPKATAAAASVAAERGVGLKNKRGDDVLAAAAASPPAARPRSRRSGGAGGGHSDAEGTATVPTATEPTATKPTAMAMAASTTTDTMTVDAPTPRSLSSRPPRGSREPTQSLYIGQVYPLGVGWLDALGTLQQTKRLTHLLSPPTPPPSIPPPTPHHPSPATRHPPLASLSPVPGGLHRLVWRWQALAGRGGGSGRLW